MRRTAPKERTGAPPIRVMIVDDHPMWRDTLRKVLELRRFASIVAEADDGEASITLAATAVPDVIVMDVALPVMSGIQATAELVQQRPDQRVLVLASSDDTDQVVSAVRAGASGYLIKTVKPAELREAVRRVHEGELVFPPAVSGAVLAALRRGDGTVGGPSPTGSLRREGDYWTLSFGGDLFRLKHRKGLSYIAHLLDQPGREVHAIDLIALGMGDQRAVRRDQGELHHEGRVDAILDPAAQASVREHIVGLEEDLAEARGWGDGERAAAIKVEIDAVNRQLASAVGLGGRSRAFVTPAERARVNVTRSIKLSIARIDAHCRPLADHLAGSIRTGTFCVYLPGPSAPTWRL